MPFFNFYNLSKEEVLKVSKETLKDIAKIVECPTDWFNYNSIESHTIVDNEIKSDICYVRVEWFKRSENIQQEVARILNNALNKIGIKETAINFIEIDIDKYYEDGKKVSF
ncbi:hypothetical protein OKW22_000846 [Bacilli bacterium PM5-3]|nr:hypothetical protein [Bacilli bacterium PM5-3]MDH6603601.1 hypothetical protein [Bacilli bacterium PM5-9]